MRSWLGSQDDNGGTHDTLQAKNLDTPDETRRFSNGELIVVNVAGVTVGRGVFQPGWRWSKDVKPIAGTDSCQAAHTG